MIKTYRNLEIDQIFDVDMDGNVFDSESHVCLDRYVSTNGIVFTLLPVVDSERKCPIQTDIIVLDAFSENPNEPSVPCHVDGNEGNCSINNLAWVREEIKWVPAKHRNYLFAAKYEVSSYGTIREIYPFGEYRILNQVTRKNYKSVCMKTDQGIKQIPVHQIVCASFWDNYDDNRPNVNHIDGFKDNNFYRNLEWVSIKENTRHAALIGLCFKKDKKHSLSDINLIKKTLIENDGMCYKTYRYLTNSGLIPNLTIYTVKAIKLKMSYPFFKNLHKKIDDKTEKLVQKILIDTNGSPMKTLHTLSKMNIELSEEAITRVKERMSYNFPRLNKAPMTDDEILSIEHALIELNGSLVKAFESITDKYPRLTINDIGTVKNRMISKGFAFPNGKLNRKISESLRAELLQLLANNDWSPSNTYSKIKDKMPDVTIYDLKYLKRKYYN